jgi:hypothetical protein
MALKMRGKSGSRRSTWVGAVVLSAAVHAGLALLATLHAASAASPPPPAPVAPSPWAGTTLDLLPEVALDSPSPAEPGGAQAAPPPAPAAVPGSPPEPPPPALPAPSPPPDLDVSEWKHIHAVPPPAPPAAQRHERAEPVDPARAALARAAREERRRQAAEAREERQKQAAEAREERQKQEAQAREERQKQEAQAREKRQREADAREARRRREAEAQAVAATSPSPPAASAGAAASASPAAGAFGAPAPVAVRDLGESFTRSIGPGNMLDKSWALLPPGDGGSIDVALRVDEGGKISGFDPVSEAPPPHLVKLVRNTLWLLRSGHFSIRGPAASAGRQVLRLHAQLSDIDPESVQGGPSGSAYSFANGRGRSPFTLSSGRRVEVSVLVLKVELAPAPR